MGNAHKHAEQGLVVNLAIEAARRGIFFVELMRSEEARGAMVVGFPHVAAAAAKFRGAFHKLVRSSGSAWAFQHDTTHFRRQLKRVIGTVRRERIEDAELRKKWGEIESGVETGSADELDRLLTGFLVTGRSAFARAVEDGASLAWRHFACLSGVAICVAILWAVEQVRSLVYERLWYGPVAALTLLLPLLAMWALALLLARGRSLGLPAWFESWARFGLFSRPAARYPQGYAVTTMRARTGRRIIASTGSQVLLFLLWLLFCAVAADWLVPPELKVLKTVVWAACIACVGLTVLAVLDVWDFVHPAPVRGVFLSFTVILWSLYAWGDVSSGIIATALVVVSLYLVFAIWVWRRAMLALTGVVLALFAVIGLVVYTEESTARHEAWRSPPPDSKEFVEPSALIGFAEWPHADSGNPVVLVAASGGGSRAALLATFALKSISETCVPCSGQEPTVPCETLGQHLQAISSVSGGSLASATYVASLMHGGALENLPGKMADDFLQQVLLGAVRRGTSRGQSLERYWDDKLALKDHLSQIAESWRKGMQTKRPALPLPIFNSATLDGHAVVVSPLRWVESYRDPAELIAGSNNEYTGLTRPTWVYYRSGVYSLDSLIPGFDPTLGQAVRASANFPFGFPVVQVETKSSLAFSPIEDDRKDGEKERVRLTDGGVVSNSGMWTLFRVLRAHKDTLKSRGVVLILVDASKMPEYGGRTRTVDLVSSIFDRSPTAGNMHATMIDFLDQALGGKLAVVELAMPAEHDSNFYTSWALDGRTLAKLSGDADRQVKAVVKTAGEAFCTLREGKVPIAKRATTRLPID